MNYYQQLLESYSLMKQRKLRLIVEGMSMEDKIAKVQSMAGLPLVIEKDPATGDYKAVTPQKKGGERRITVVKADGTVPGQSITWNTAWGQLFPDEGETEQDADAEEAEDTAKGAVEQEKLERQQAREVAHQWQEFESNNPLAHSFGWSPEDLLAGIRHIFFTKVQPNLREYLEKAETLTKVDGKVDYDIKVGNQSGSLEQKLTNIGKGKQEEMWLDPEVGLLPMTEAERKDRSELIAGVTDTLNEVMDHAIHSDGYTQEQKDDICKGLDQRIRKTGNWGLAGPGGNKKLFIFHSNEPDQHQGITMAPGTIEQRMVTRLEKMCGGKELAGVDRDVTQHGSSDIGRYRGNIVESLVSLNYFALGMKEIQERIHEAEAIGDRLTAEQLAQNLSEMDEWWRGAVSKLFGKNLDLSVKAFAFMQQAMDSAVDLDDDHLISLLEQELPELKKFGAGPGLKNIFSRINFLGAELRKEIAIATGGKVPAAVVPVGGLTGWGYKADTASVFLDKSDADKVAKRLDSKVTTSTWAELRDISKEPEMVDMYMKLNGITDPNSEIHYVGDSLKAYSNYSSSKLSDLHGWSNVHTMLAGMWGSKNKSGHLEKVKEELGLEDDPKTGTTHQRLKDASKYWSNGPGKIYNILEGLLGTDKEYVRHVRKKDKAIELVGSNPKEVLMLIKDTWKKESKLSFSELEDSAIMKILTGPDGRLIDMDDQVIREGAKERLQRLMITNRVNQDLTAGGAKQRNARCAMAFMIWTSAGSATDDFNDVRDLSRNEAHLFGQNDGPRDLGNWLMSDSPDNSWEIKTDGHFNTQFHHKESGGMMSISRGSQKSTTKDEKDALGNVIKEGIFKRITRQTININRSLAKWYSDQRKLRHAQDVPTLEANSTVLKYIKGQMKLLEELSKDCS